MKIYTKTGDHGETGYIGGRISKAADMIELIGELDELNSVLGVVLANLLVQPQTHLQTDLPAAPDQQVQSGKGSAKSARQSAKAKTSSKIEPVHSTDIAVQLSTIQAQLFSLGAIVAQPTIADTKANQEKTKITEWTKSMESLIDQLEEELEPLRNFILPGGSLAGAGLHHARTVCRRAERAGVRLIAGLVAQPDSQASYQANLEVVQKYLNRLSDALFTLARYTNKIQSSPEETWSGDSEQTRLGI
jgi:cob(I)alamin adenosyltransferase